MTEIAVPNKCYEELVELLSLIQEDIINLPVSPMDDAMESKLFKILRQVQSIKDNLVGMYD